MATLILIRHGQSVANAEHRFTTGPHEPLTEQGRQEARSTARYVEEHYDPVALYASPFARALETARLIGESFGLEPEVVDPLHEQSFGELHGRPYADLGKVDVVHGSTRWQLRPPGGETLEEVALRSGPALDAIARRHLREHVLVVSHGAVMAALRGHVLGQLDGQPEFPGNALGYVVEWNGEVYRGPFPFETEPGDEG